VRDGKNGDEWGDASEAEEEEGRRGRVMWAAQ